MSVAVAEPSPVPGGRQLAASAAVAAVLQVATMLVGALLAVLILARFGKAPRTDGVLAAYGVYSVLLVFAQTFRYTVVPRLAEEGVERGLERFAAGGLLLFGVAGVVLWGFAGPVSRALTANPAARDAARSALPLFWLASGAQLIAALGAAALAVRAEFALPGVAYVAGGLCAAVVLEAAAGPLGTDAVAVAVLAGSCLTAAVILGRLALVGWRPRWRSLLPRRRTWSLAVTMVTGAVTAVMGQVLYLVSVAFAARLGPGETTLYAYAFFATSVLIGGTSAPAGMVIAAPLAEDWDRRPRSLRPQIADVTRAGLVIIAPVVALAAAVGAVAIDLLFGARLATGDAATVVVCFVTLSPIALAIAAGIVPLLAAFTLERYRAVAAAAAGTAAVHVAATALAAAIFGTLPALAAAAAVSGVAGLVLTAPIALGHEVVPVLRGVARETGLVAAVAATTLGVPIGLAALVGGWPLRALAWLLGAGLFLAAVRLLPGYADVTGRMLSPLARLLPRSARRPA